MTLENQATAPAKNRLDRVFAIILAAVSVLALFLPYTVIKSANAGNYEKGFTLLFLSLGGKGGVGLVLMLVSIVYLLTAAASAALNIIAIFKEDFTTLFIRIGSLVLSAGAGLYTLSVFTISSYLENTSKTPTIAATFDFVSIAIAIIAVGIYGFLAFQKNKKACLKPLAQYGTTLLSTVLLAAAVAFSSKQANIIVVALLALAILSLVVAQLFVMFKPESAILNRIRLIAHAAIAFVFFVICLFVLGGGPTLLSFLAIVVAAVFVAENFLHASEEEETEEEANEGYVYSEYSDNGEEEFDENEPELEMFPSIPRPKMVSQDDGFAFEQPAPEAAPAPADAPAAEPAPAATITLTEGYRVEEYAEAYAYEGGPVEGVELAEEVNPTFMPQGKVSTGGYDFYNCQSFDPFIASLNNEERNQFTEIFILKYKGVMPEIPDYI